VEDKMNISRMDKVNPGTTVLKREKKTVTTTEGSLLSFPGKVLCLVLLDRLQAIINPQLLESQCGFRPGRGTVDQIWSARQIVERSIEYESSAYLGFVDLTKAYDSVDRSALLSVLSHYGVPRHLIDMVRELYTGTYCRVRTSEGVSDVFEVKSGMRQGCVLSPLLFNAYTDKIVRDATAAYEGGLQVEYTTSGGLFLTYRDKTPANTCVPNIQYADDLTVCAESRGDLQSMLLVLNTSCTKWGMKINGEKTKVLSIGEAGDDHPPITLNGQIIEEVDSFSYLGSEVDKMGKVEKEVGVRLEKAATVYHMWRRIKGLP
jgi:hypothetical protein